MSSLFAADLPPYGAYLPWTTVEAEAMTTDGEQIGPGYAPHTIETESSHQWAVRLSSAGSFVEFQAPVSGDALVLRYNVPDQPQRTTLVLSVNDQIVRTIPLSPRNVWLYGTYPFSNDAAKGKPRNFYDEVRVPGVVIAAGDTVRLAKAIVADDVPVVLDLVDIETMGAPVSAPEQALDARQFGAVGDGVIDDTGALRNAIAEAAATGRPLWVPAGQYLVTGDLDVPSGVTIQGAGMWYTTFVGSPALYDQADRRVRFKLKGEGMTLADFAITGALNYRNDQEENDGVVGAGCADATIARLWIEHTKAGAWIYNGARLTITGCRFRNLIADGVNLCVATTDSVIENCSARGTGDDCFAIWPAPADQGYVDENIVPGNNVIRHCTGQLTFLANGASVYGGANNRVEFCHFTDIGTGCGILISTTFPTVDEERGINNNFSGTTVVRDNVLERCGGYDHGWAWRGSMQLCMHHQNIAGLQIERIKIVDSFSDGLTVVGPGSVDGKGILSDTKISALSVEGVGLGTDSSHAVFVRADARGDLTLEETATAVEVHNESEHFEVHRP
ncbi:glycosyl hydrolase family 28-related protein [Actomonas aquatica]|uniref:Glycosyl hydrolase family 28-related protein n=1 Tax=Actomonas aquatica TaxID=2866162 RepID=A0ABZ1CHD5_9BACT|nr:glycosyl hydrolase family 28-related protein [Opitutus sp. WL0086]WRQ89994.1 glycosyl hydrolase family 28-related protein [Opitutus sp. WL0086]